MEPHVKGVTVAFLLSLISDCVLTECSPGCTSCSGSTCLSCESSYFLSDDFCSPCPEDCNSCNGDGFSDCTSCKSDKWGLYSKCSLDCDSRCSNVDCLDDTGFCVQCNPGLYGFKCQHNCSLCADERCDLRSCSQGCKQGYYEYKTQSQSFCQNCPSNCKYCNDSSTCHACNDNFYLFQFSVNGKDYVHCLSCSLGPICSNHCSIHNCNQCQIQNYSLVCTDCPEGQRFNGVICIPNTINCSQECSSHCDDDGICLGNCNAGWTGDRCSDKCSDKCLTCEKGNKDICQKCKGDYYTVNCNVACNPSCIKENGKQTCRLTDGYCLNGCEHNFWGNVCDQSCSNGCVDTGISPLCERDNGTCKYGCKDGYMGDKCDITSTITSKTIALSEAEKTTQEQISTQYEREENGGCKSSFLEGFLSGLGTSIVVAVITATVFIFTRRYIGKKYHQESDKTIEMPTYYNETAGPTNETQEAVNETNDYERLGNTRNTDSFYNDLETTPAQQSASYYNMSVRN